MDAGKAHWFETPQAEMFHAYGFCWTMSIESTAQESVLHAWKTVQPAIPHRCNHLKSHLLIIGMVLAERTGH
jgi:hypothetical protein